MRGVIDATKLTNIAGAIREKAGTEKTYKPDDMVEGVTEVFEAGRKDFEEELLNGEW